MNETNSSQSIKSKENKQIKIAKQNIANPY
jgi:hypothetical protein